MNGKSPLWAGATATFSIPSFWKKKIDAAAPDIIFNTIAWTQVDDAEDHPGEAACVNCGLPKTLARIASLRDNLYLYHFSTDFIFSGSNHVPLTEEDEALPQSVYGSTKLAGEKAILDILPERSCILRTAWLFGPGKKNFVKTILSVCENRDAVKVVDDQTGSPTYTRDLAEWTVALAEKRATGIWNAVNSGVASWYELADEAVKMLSASCRVMPITSAEWPQKAKRPGYSVLDNSKLAAFLGKKPRPWPQALRDYLFGEFPGQTKEGRS